MNTRPLNNWETSMLRRLLVVDFPGSGELRLQLESASAIEVAGEQSVQFKLNAHLPRASVVGRVPIEARALDEDGVHINVLIHVVNGLLHEMEIYRDDSQSIAQLPSPDAFDVVVHKSDFNPYEIP